MGWKRGIRTGATALAAGCVAAVLCAPSGSAADGSQTSPRLGAKAGAATVSSGLPKGVALYQVRRSILGTHTWYQQRVGTVPVYGGWYGVHQYDSGKRVVDDVRGDVSGLATTTPAVAKTAATAKVVTLNKSKSKLADQSVDSTTLYVLPATGTTPARLAWLVSSTGTHGEIASFVDAKSGTLIKREKTSRDRVAKARVLSPNPVVRLNNEKLRDQGDRNKALPGRAYRTVTLKNLYKGTKKLHGRWAWNVNARSVDAVNGNYFYYRRNDNFEQVNAYYAIDRVQNYFHKIGIKHANAERQKYATNTFADDNSFYSPGNDKIEFGSGGVDDAEDQEVVWHEYGHAVQDDQVPGFGTTEEGGAMGEGFGDYLAATMSQATAVGTKISKACVMDWDSTSYTPGPVHCIRRLDTDKHYPEDATGEVHDDGEIWSGALWSINKSLGRYKANRIILEAQFSWAPNQKFAGAASKTVSTARSLYGDGAAAKVKAAFVHRGILES